MVGFSSHASGLIRVLIVDDEPAARKLLATVLKEAGVECISAASGEKALRILESVPLDAILTDLRMPGISGMELLAKIRPRFPFLAFLMVTGEDDVRVGIQAMKSGAEDYLVKPLQVDLVLASLDRALEKKRLEQELDNYHRRLEDMVKERTAQLESALGQIERGYEDTLKTLGAAIDLRDSQTAGHSQRVALYSRRIATKLGATEDELRTITWGAWLHDIGKLAIPDAILLKPGPLTDEEWVIMRSHVRIGYDLIKRIPFLNAAAEIVLTHHERCDGSGYPQGLTGVAIPLGARIFAIADTLDAMTSDRPYRPAGSFEEAHKEIQFRSGSRYDLEVVKAFLSIGIDGWKAIHLQAAAS
jgi:putative nucleotidyltransferase with HDIG domain